MIPGAFRTFLLLLDLDSVIHPSRGCAHTIVNIMDEAELNAIRQARLAELQNSATRTPSAQDDQKITVLSQVLETSARERLARVRIVRPERAEQVEQYLVKMVQMGNIRKKVTEDDIVSILDSLARDQGTQSKIVFNRKNDDDSDDDFFD